MTPANNYAMQAGDELNEAALAAVLQRALDATSAARDAVHEEASIAKELQLASSRLLADNDGKLASSVNTEAVRNLALKRHELQSVQARLVALPHELRACRVQLATCSQRVSAAHTVRPSHPVLLF